VTGVYGAKAQLQAQLQAQLRTFRLLCKGESNA